MKLYGKKREDLTTILYGIFNYIPYLNNTNTNSLTNFIKTGYIIYRFKYKKKVLFNYVNII